MAGYSYALQSFNENNIPNLEDYSMFISMQIKVNPEQALMRAKLFILKERCYASKSMFCKAIDLGIDKTELIMMQC
ncbi:MAG: hypothetical protein IPL21_14580 [Saprospirales bacterium]|nr:hypothetical protein [Saprospirales bacterium]